MTVDIKVGGNTITGVSFVRYEDATTPGTYDVFAISNGLIPDITFSLIINIVCEVV